MRYNPELFERVKQTREAHINYPSEQTAKEAKEALMAWEEQESKNNIKGL